MALTAGSRLGRYVIVRQLGAGAMGEVYLAEDPHIDRQVAIKTVRLDAQEQMSDATRSMLAQRFEREAKVAGRLVHPHVVTLFDVGDVDGLFFLAFEYIDGPDLAARSRQQPSLTLRDIVRIGREAAAALEAAHRVGIIHRDIKPSNLLLTRDGLLKIADFGIATLVGQGTHLTQTGSLIGTPQYLSPEQVQSEQQLDGRSDLFSLGVVLYELLSGRRPFEGASMAALLYAVVSAEPRPLQELRPDLPPRLTAAVMRLLAKAPDARFPTAAVFGDEMAAIDRELTDSGSATTLLQPEQVPTIVQSGPVTLPTRAATTTSDIVPSTIHQGVPPPAVPPTTQIEASAQRRGSRGIIAGAVIVLGLIAGVITTLNWRQGNERPATTTPQRAVAQTESQGEVVEVSPASAVTTSATVTQSATAASETIADEYQPVGGGVTFRVTPGEAASSAIVKVDGLVRGLGGSMITLRAGHHTIELIAEGYEPAKLLVDSRSDAPSPTELAITLTPK